MRSRLVDPFLAVRFVSLYEGSPGAPFRSAMAAYFGVSGKTVKRELPRLVAAGFLEEETLPGRGAPKLYRAAARRPRRWRTLDLYLDGGGRTRPTGMARAADRVGVSLGEFASRYREGVVAFCPRCGRSEIVCREYATPTICEHGAPLRADGYPLQPEPEPVGPRRTLAELLAEAEAADHRL